MKFVDQTLFDVAALELAKVIGTSPTSASSFIHGLFAAYQDSFPGDHTWTDQVQKAATDLLTTAKAITPDDYAVLLSLTAQARKNLGDDLKPVSTARKMFNGTFWSKSHPAPASREEISVKNGKTLLIMVNSRR
jgi:hypothetical protein